MSTTTGMEVTVCTVGTTRCGVQIGHNPAVLHLNPSWMKFVQVGIKLTVLDYHMVWHEGELHIHAEDHTKTTILIHPSERRGTLQHGELFAGMGGWDNVADTMGFHTKVFVDKDAKVTELLSKSKNAHVYDASTCLNMILQGHDFDSVILNDSISNPAVWMVCGLLNVAYCNASPPCQPWSTAGGAKGLDADDGLAFQDMLRWGGKLKIFFLAVENVPGIKKHADLQTLVREAAASGMVLVMHDVFSIEKILPMTRVRWLALFVHSDVKFNPEFAQMARSISFDNRSFMSLAVSPSIVQADALHVNMTTEERAALMIPEAATIAMSDDKKIPLWLKYKMEKSHNTDVLKARTIHGHEQVSGAMASHGSQHLIEDSMLNSKGLHTVIMHDELSEGNRRYISPWEFAASQGYQVGLVLDPDLSTSWRLVGNGIASAHAWLQIHKIHVMFQDDSPYRPQGDVSEQIRQICQSAIKLSKWEAKNQEGYWVLVEKTQEPALKKFKGEISPTVPFAVVEIPDDDGEQHEGCLSTKAFHKMPAFLHMRDHRNYAVEGLDYGGGLVMVAHSQKNWCTCVNTDLDMKIADIMCKGLPHAQAHHFAQLLIGHDTVQWEQIVSCRKFMAIEFCPVFQNVTFAEESLQLAVQLKVDVTWTAKTAAAFIATKLNCNPDAIVVSRGANMLEDHEFLNYYEKVDFGFRFKACMPGYVSWAQSQVKPADPGLFPVLLPHKQKRWFARHPSRKSLRTIMVDDDTTVRQLIQMLFPDVHASVQWVVFNDGDEVDRDRLVMPLSDLQVQWNGFRPLPVTNVTRVTLPHAIDNPFVQTQSENVGTQRSVRTPPKVLPEDFWLPGEQTIGDVAASFFITSQVQTNVLCMQGSQVLDPNMLEHVENTQTITFRICPLLAGAKNEALKNVLRTMLETRGVSAECLTERVTTVMNKIPLDKTNMIKDAQDPESWNQLKKVATDHKVRLILPAELKAFQQTQRQKDTKKERAANVNMPKVKHQKKEEREAIKVEHLTIDANNFQAGEGAPQILEVGRFGPDQSGMCIVTPEEGRRLIKHNVKSCDPLAALIIGEHLQEFGAEVFSLPAHTTGQQPIIVKACLLNFGDEPVTFKLSIPSVSIEPEAATTIEFSIHRSLIDKWSDTAMPLHYLGIHVSALRGSHLLATWSIKPWGEGKKVIGHAKASYWHGYFRIPDRILVPVLSRSGVAGIFFHAKGSDKRADPRFTTIALPNRSYKEVMDKAEACVGSLGLAKFGSTYAIRCKREDADELRSRVLPETAFVEVAPVAADDTMYVIKNCPQVARDELSKALEASGWAATAIRPQGGNRWLVAAKNPPRSSHLAINGMITMIEPIHKKESTFTVVARAMQVDATSTMVDPNNQLVQHVTTSTRMAEIRIQLEGQIAEQVEAKLTSANARIQELSSAIQELRDQSAQVQAESAFTRTKLQEVEQSVATSGGLIVKQMETMFQNMQTTLQANLEQSLKGMIKSDSGKRLCTGGTEARNDPFCTKSG
eukprot:Skav222844  [mRNA]  locus=scaffold1263:166803:171323:+ [translate_table: standard]